MGTTLMQQLLPTNYSSLYNEQHQTLHRFFDTFWGVISTLRASRQLQDQQFVSTQSGLLFLQTLLPSQQVPINYFNFLTASPPFPLPPAWPVATPSWLRECRSKFKFCKLPKANGDSRLTPGSRYTTFFHASVVSITIENTAPVGIPASRGSFYSRAQRAVLRLEP